MSEELLYSELIFNSPPVPQLIHPFQNSLVERKKIVNRRNEEPPVLRRNFASYGYGGYSINNKIYFENTFTPIVVSPQILKLLQEGFLGLADPKNPDNHTQLTDVLPFAKNGWGVLRSFMLLLRIYCMSNGLLKQNDTINPDFLLTEILNQNTVVHFPIFHQPEYYYYIPINEAIDRNIYPSSRSKDTFSVLEFVFPDFDRNNFDAQKLELIMDMNAFKEEDLNENNTQTLLFSVNKNQMIREYDYLEEILIYLDSLFSEPKNFANFLAKNYTFGLTKSADKQ